MLWPDENKYDEIIETYALINEVPVPLIKAVMAKESSFDPTAYREEPQIGDASRGLMQLLFKTARGLGFGGNADDLLDPLTSIEYGSKLLAANLKQANGDVPTAVAAYNAGWGKTNKHDAPRDANGNFVNQGYVDDINVYYGYFSGNVSEGDVQSYKQGRMIQGAMPFFLSSP